MDMHTWQILAICLIAALHSYLGGDSEKRTFMIKVII